MSRPLSHHHGIEQGILCLSYLLCSLCSLSFTILSLLHFCLVPSSPSFLLVSPPRTPPPRACEPVRITDRDQLHPMHFPTRKTPFGGKCRRDLGTAQPTAEFVDMPYPPPTFADEGFGLAMSSRRDHTGRTCILQLNTTCACWSGPAGLMTCVLTHTSQGQHAQLSGC